MPSYSMSICPDCARPPLPPNPLTTPRSGDHWTRGTPGPSPTYRKITKGRQETTYNTSIYPIRYARVSTDLADGEGFEPPVFLSILRFSRPTLSTAQTSILFCYLLWLISSVYLNTRQTQERIFNQNRAIALSKQVDPILYGSHFFIYFFQFLCLSLSPYYLSIAYPL